MKTHLQAQAYSVDFKLQTVLVFFNPQTCHKAGKVLNSVYCILKPSSSGRTSITNESC